MKTLREAIDEVLEEFEGDWKHSEMPFGLREEWEYLKSKIQEREPKKYLKLTQYLCDRGGPSLSTESEFVDADGALQPGEVKVKEDGEDFTVVFLVNLS